ncbi:hypothetical protein BDZ45DRAFT_450319 [Acephala macrosclerotiorum]|nr:hypothetical protein BDZ45DRAFT_450319 [Acephala macrosclerotiorum]
MQPISVPHHLSLIQKPYTQTLLSTIDSTHEIKIALLEGPYIFHSHSENDEAFFLVSGSLVIEILHEEGGGNNGKEVTGRKGGDEGNGMADGGRRGEEVKMQAGDLFVVPKGVKHRPIGREARVMVIEKKGVWDGSGGLAKPVGE